MVNGVIQANVQMPVDVAGSMDLEGPVDTGANNLYHHQLQAERDSLLLAINSLKSQLQSKLNQ